MTSLLPLKPQAALLEKDSEAEGTWEFVQIERDASVGNKPGWTVRTGLSPDIPRVSKHLHRLSISQSRSR